MHRSDLDLDNQQGAVAWRLRARLSDMRDLVAMMNQAYWAIGHRKIRQVRLALDPIAEAAEAHASLLAERLATLCGSADDTDQVQGDTNEVGDEPMEALDCASHLHRLAASLARFNAKVRVDIEVAHSHGDMGTAELLAEIDRVSRRHVRILETHL